MSSDTDDLALSVRDLGKSYEIVSGVAAGNKTIVESIRQRIRQPFDRPKRSTFWAARDMNFDIRRGEVVGLVGRNGAGKSTLLKLLARITPPTTGRIDIWGRVGSLLEVGTGFHPELTGRENIFMNGAVLGMSRAEILRQFDDIVEFAEVSKFLDTPVKRYSSGMYVRLAFAVAAHLNPEILIVDEVLAVGDAAFQKKCLGKMNDVARGGGRTVLFVSHNMAAVRSLCTRALFLAEGKVALDSTTENVVRRYIADGAGSGSRVYWDDLDSGDIRFISGAVLDGRGVAADLIGCSEPFTLEVEYEVKRNLPQLRIACWLQTIDGVPLCCSYDPNYAAGPVAAGRFVARCTFPPFTINEGRFLARFDADIPGDRVILRTPENLTVTIEDLDGHGLLSEKLPGIIRPRLTWEVAAGPSELPDTAGAMTAGRSS